MRFKMIMKYRNLLLIIALVSSQSISYAQTGVSVNNNGTAAHEKAILDVSSETQGVLLPRMSTVGRFSTANSPATSLHSSAYGLMVFFDADLKQFCYWNSIIADWQCIDPERDGGVSGPKVFEMVAESGQNLDFVAGELVCIGFAQGGTTSYMRAAENGPLGNTLDWKNNSDLEGGSGFNTNPQTSTQTAIRLIIEFTKTNHPYSTYFLNLTS